MVGNESCSSADQVLKMIVVTTAAAAAADDTVAVTVIICLDSTANVQWWPNISF